MTFLRFLPPVPGYSMNRTFRVGYGISCAQLVCLSVNRGRQCYTMASEEEPVEKRISEIFADGMKIFDDLSKTSEATNSSTVQVSARNTKYAYYCFVGNISVVNVCNVCMHLGYVIVMDLCLSGTGEESNAFIRGCYKISVYSRNIQF